MAQQLSEQKRERGQMGKDNPQKLLLLKGNGAALSLPDYREIEKPKKANGGNALKKAGHDEPVEEEEEEEEEEGDETDEDEEEEAEENEARGEFRRRRGRECSDGERRFARKP